MVSISIMRRLTYIIIGLCMLSWQSIFAAGEHVSAEEWCMLAHRAMQEERFDEALSCYQRGQSLYVEQYGTSSPEYALTESYIGYAAYRLGMYVEAESHYQQALHLLSRMAGGTAHPLYFYTLNNLATLMLDRGDYHRALEHYLSLHHAASSTPNTLLYKTLSNNMATAHYFLHHYAVADSIYSVLLSSLSPNQEDELELYRHVLNNSTRSALEQRNYHLADSCLSLVVASYPLSERNTAAYTYVMDMQALTRQLMGDYAQAERIMKQVVDVRRRTLGEQHPDYVLALNNLAHLYAVMEDDDKANHWYALEFDARTRSVVTNLLGMSERQRLLYVEKMDLVFENYLSYAYRSYPHNPQAAAGAYDDVLFYKALLLNTANLVSEHLRHSADTLLCPDYQQWYDAFHVTHTALLSHLSAQMVALEFADFPIADNDRQYIALLLRGGSSAPQLIPLCKESDLAFVSAPNSCKSIYDYEWEGERLHRLIWAPIAPYINPSDTICYSMSGLLHLINLEAVPLSETAYVGDDHVMIRMSSTRQVLESASDDVCTDAALFGGVRYDDSTSSAKGRHHIPFLRNALEGILLLRDTLEQHQVHTHLYAEYAATKDSLCAMSGSSVQLIHVSTHGYYLPADTTQRMSSLRRQLIRCSTTPGIGLSDGMERSGLMMAGAEAVIGDSTLDAFSRTIVTARDVSLLDLSATHTVVISACESAQGDVHSDGVFGFQRAFKQAGVQTIVMTLWKVDDFVTKEMMLSFYRHWLESGHKREAFKRAVSEIRAQYPEPESWAAYIMLE